MLTRRQRWIVARLNAGWVAELLKPLRKRLHPSTSRRYIMRHPKATEPDGAIVTGRTVDTLIETGFAIRVSMPWNDKTWVWSRSLYENSPMGSIQKAASASSSTTTSPQNSSTPTSST